jgi:hypothetical protein
MDETPISNPFDEDERSGSQPIVWALLGIVAIGCGVIFAIALFYFQPDAKSLYAQYFPSPTVTPSRTPTSTPTLTPTATSTSTPTPNMTVTIQVQNAQSTAENALSSWKIIRTDTFDSNKNNWLVEESEDEYGITNYEIVAGKYRWDSTAHKSFIGWVRADRKALTDFYLSVDIQQMEGPDTADYGVIFREDDNSNFYYFGISDNGQYVLYLFFEEWDTLINWTETDLIKPGEINRLTVVGEVSHFTFFINDHYLTEITDSTIPSGSTALVIEMADENDRAIFEFDNFELRAP